MEPVFSPRSTDPHRVRSDAFTHFREWHRNCFYSQDEFDRSEQAERDEQIQEIGVMARHGLRKPVIMPGTFAGPRLERWRSVMRRSLDSGELPGLVCLVSHKDRVHIETMGCFGFESGIESRAPMQRNTIFRLASMSKPITAVAAMILIEECRMRLDDPVDPWLPELKDRVVLRNVDGPLDDTVPAKRSITVRDLLTFRSGYGEVAFLAPQSPLQKALIQARLPLSVWPYQGTADEFMKALGGLPLACQPGERWLYHMGAEILGVLIARVAGVSLGRFFEQRIFEPLGMVDTGFHVPKSKWGRLPVCYGSNFPSKELIVLDGNGESSYMRQPAFESGAGGLVSTVDDMLAFGRMLLRKGAYGNERILSRAAVELMTADHITQQQKAASPFFDDFWVARGWGLGLSVVTGRYDLGCGPGSFGWDGAYGTSWYVDPKEDLVGVLMTQRRPSKLGMPVIAQDFWASVYQLIDD